MVETGDGGEGLMFDRITYARGPSHGRKGGEVNDAEHSATFARAVHEEVRHIEREAKR